MRSTSQIKEPAIHVCDYMQAAENGILHSFCSLLKLSSGADVRLGTAASV